ncbi:MAG: hypothetical protein PHE67_13340 [Campylobacterales bacterium]|nr:hypothetical protein [Campylobacterales bacterium]
MNTSVLSSLLVTFGIAIGYLLASFCTIENIFDALSAIGAIFTAIAAYMALNTWKRQEHYKNITKAQKLFKEVVGLFHAYYYNVHLAHTDNNILENTKEWKAYIKKLTKYHFACLLISDDSFKNFEFKFDKLQGKLLDLLQETKNVDFEYCMAQILRDGLKSFSDIKNKS